MECKGIKNSLRSKQRVTFSLFILHFWFQAGRRAAQRQPADETCYQRSEKNGDLRDDEQFGTGECQSGYEDGHGETDPREESHADDMSPGYPLWQERHTGSDPYPREKRDTDRFSDYEPEYDAQRYRVSQTL